MGYLLLFWQIFSTFVIFKFSNRTVLILLKILLRTHHLTHLLSIIITTLSVKINRSILMLHQLWYYLLIIMQIITFPISMSSINRGYNVLGLSWYDLGFLWWFTSDRWHVFIKMWKHKLFCAYNWFRLSWMHICFNDQIKYNKSILNLYNLIKVVLV